jgi:hypothetical protein
VSAQVPPTNDDAPIPPGSAETAPEEEEKLPESDSAPEEPYIRPVAEPAPGAQPQSMSIEIPIGGYQGPMSRRAARAFATGTSPPAVTAQGGVSSRWVVIVIATAVVTGLLLGGLAYLFLQSRGRPILTAPPPAAGDAP